MDAGAGQMAELRAAGKSDEAEHAKVTEEVQRELVALASQHREVVAALEERSSEVNSLMVRLLRSCWSCTRLPDSGGV